MAMFLVCFGIASAHSEDESSLDAWVEQLNDSSYHARMRASRELIAAANGENSDRLLVIRSLQRGLAHDSLEVRMAAQETLGAIKQCELDRQIEILTNPQANTTEIRLPGWGAFSSLAGKDMAARHAFVVALENFPTILQQIESKSSLEYDKKLATLAHQLDPYRIASDDTARWIMLLWLDIQLSDGRRVSSQSPRILMSLTNSAMGPTDSNKTNLIVLRRMIDQWVRVQSGETATREWLLVATRYGCGSLVSELCDRVFRAESAPPATIVIALLSSLAQQRSDLELQASRYLEDNRTAHVWQMVTSRKSKIRTQVRDVAMVALLHSRGFDPRTAGFEELLADPILVFRDHSLGFANETQRETAFHQSHLMLRKPDADSR